MHQRNLHIERKLRVWRFKKCISLVCAKTALTCAGLQTTPSHVRQYRAETEICRNPGLPFAIVPCLHQNNVYIQKKLRVCPKMYFSSRCKNRTYPSGTANDPSHVSQYRAKNGNLTKSGSTFCHGTMFARKQSLYHKEDTGMESPKMYFSSRCKIRTYPCGTANDPVSCKSVWGREWKFAEILVYLLP